MAFDFSKFLSALKFAPRVLFGIALASGVAAFSPPRLIDALGFRALLDQHRAWVSASFLISAALFVSTMLAHVADFYWPLLRDRLQVRIWRGGFKNLSPSEKELLCKYLQGNTSVACRISSGLPAGLVGKEILYRASNVSHPGHPGTQSFDYNMHPWAREYLSKHPELVGFDPEAGSGVPPAGSAPGEGSHSRRAK